MPVEARPPVVVTLGGRLITRTREPERVRPKVLARLAGEVTGVSDPPVFLLHGAGSFGAVAARTLGLDRAPENGRRADRRIRAAAVVSAEVRRLHVAVLRELVRAGGSPFSVPPATFVRAREGRVISVDPDPIVAALAAGAMPVSFGDVVPDEAWAFSVVSADSLAAHLAPAVRTRRAVFASDAPGLVASSGPGRPAVIPELTEAALNELGSGTPGAAPWEDPHGTAIAMRAIAHAGADAVLISGLTDGAVSRAIRGEPVYGTWAHARPREGPGPRSARPEPP